MSVDVDRKRLYCTISETHFGPEFTSDEEGFELIAYIWRVLARDVRELDPEERLACLLKIRSGEADREPTHHERLCLCGSGKPWRSRGTKLGKPTVTRCEVCS